MEERGPEGSGSSPGKGLAGLPGRSARALLDAQRRLLRPATEAAEKATLDAVDAVLASKFAEEIVERIVDGPGIERLIDRIVESKAFHEAVVRLLESDDLWLLVDEIAQSPAVLEAVSQQGRGFADQVAAEVRSRSHTADDWLERGVARALRRRAASREPEDKPSGASGPGPE